MISGGPDPPNTHVVLCAVSSLWYLVWVVGCVVFVVLCVSVFCVCCLMCDMWSCMCFVCDYCNQWTNISAWHAWVSIFFQLLLVISPRSIVFLDTLGMLFFNFILKLNIFWKLFTSCTQPQYGVYTATQTIYRLKEPGSHNIHRKMLLFNRPGVAGAVL